MSHFLGFKKIEAICCVAVWLQILIVMTVYTHQDGGMKRELLLYGERRFENEMKGLIETLQQNSVPIQEDDDLYLVSSDPHQPFFITKSFSLDPSFSRKVISPLIVPYFQS